MTSRPDLAVPQPRRTSIGVGLVHLAFVLGALWAAFAISIEFAVGLLAASPLYVSIAVVLIGAVRAFHGIAGGRQILAAGELGTAIGIAAHIVTTGEPFLRASVVWFAIVIALGLVAAGSAMLLAESDRGRIERSNRDRKLLIALVAFDAIAVAVSAVTSAFPDIGAASGGSGFVLDTAISLTLPTIAFDLAVFAAWWWGARWPVALAAAVGLIAILVPGPAPGANPVRLLAYMIPSFLGVAAGFVGPRLIPSETVADHADPADTSRRFRAADVWLALGGVLWPLLVLIGYYPPVSDLCFECGPGFPGDRLLVALGQLSIVVVPLATLVAVWRGHAHGPGGRIFFAVLLAMAGLLLVQVIAGIMGVARFEFLGVAGAPILLVGIGALVGLTRPASLAGTGAIAALGAGVLVVIWAWSARGLGPSSSFVGASFIAGSLVQAALTAIGIAWESSRARRLLPASSPAMG